MNKLPLWVEKFNQLNLPDKYLSQTWNTLKPIDQYIESGPDDTPYEVKFERKDKSTFPYNLSELRKKNGNYWLLRDTPMGDDLLTELAKAAIDGEKLGADEWTDFLCLSYSAPDGLGHAVGPNAVELEDLYMRLDKNLEDLLNKLDQTAGVGKYTVFLTADHAVADVPQFLIDNKVPAGYVSGSFLKSKLNEYLQKYFPGKNVVAEIMNEQIYLDHTAFSTEPKIGGVDMLIATELITNFLLQQEGLANVYPKSVIRQGDFNEGGHKGMVVRGFNTKRSGDLAFVLEPAWIEGNLVQGTTHGSSYTYDTHVPILFYGSGIKKGSSVQYHAITDIAATLAVLLKIKFPNGCTGQPISELFD